MSPYVIYDDDSELSEADSTLLRRAHEAALDAYCPYSHFAVGAAVRLANGEIVTGCNIENAAYPSGLCAERVAMFGALARYPKVAIEAIAITAHSETTVIDEPIAPCGSCRQVMVEVEQQSGCPLHILCQGEKGIVMAFDGIETLMPFIFVDKFL